MKAILSPSITLDVISSETELEESYYSKCGSDSKTGTSGTPKVNKSKFFTATGLPLFEMRPSMRTCTEHITSLLSEFSTKVVTSLSTDTSVDRMTSAKQLNVDNLEWDSPWVERNLYDSKDSSPQSQNGLTTNWNVPFSGDHTSGDLSHMLGQRTLAGNSHQRQPSDMSINSFLSSGPMANNQSENWATNSNYVASSGPFVYNTHSQQPIATSPLLSFNAWSDQRSSLSSNDSATRQRNSIASIFNEDEMLLGHLKHQNTDHRSSIAELMATTSFGRSPSPLSSNNYFNEIPTQTNGSVYTEPVLVSVEDIKNYFGTPIPEKLNILKSNSYFRKSLGENLPKFNSEIDIERQFQFVIVCFKNVRLDIFLLANEMKEHFKIGDFVIVEADRGLDLGKIAKLGLSEESARLMKTKLNSDQRTNTGKTTEEVRIAGLELPRKVVKLATNEEVEIIGSKMADEVTATKICQKKVVEYGLNMLVDDCEYQWDKNKLTFYYQSDQRVDFRELIREMFRIYKARIWMSKVSTLYTGCN